MRTLIITSALCMVYLTGVCLLQAEDKNSNWGGGNE